MGPKCSLPKVNTSRRAPVHSPQCVSLQMSHRHPSDLRWLIFRHPCQIKVIAGIDTLKKWVHSIKTRVLSITSLFLWIMLIKYLSHLYSCTSSNTETELKYLPQCWNIHLACAYKSDHRQEDSGIENLIQTFRLLPQRLNFNTTMRQPPKMVTWSDV